MGKHSIQKNVNNAYSQTIKRQGERLVLLEDKVKELEKQLTQERADRIEDLKEIKFLLTSNHYNNEEIFLRKIAELTREKLKRLTNGIIM